MRSIVLDPGHGGADARGRSSPDGARFGWGGKEKDVVLDVAHQVARRLGSRARLTRARDVNLSLGERIEVARAADARVFVSLHASAGRAAETYVHTRATDRSRRLGRALGRCLRGATATADMAILSPEHHRADTAACLIELGEPPSDPAQIARLGGTIADALEIFEHNDMQGVEDIHVLPFRYIARLRVGQASTAGWGHIDGSGTLIEPNIILTSAHNLVRRTAELGTTFADAAKIDVWLDGVGPLGATGWWVHGEWMRAMREEPTIQRAEDRGTPFDYGLIRLDTSTINAWPLGAVDPAALGPVQVAGWPKAECTTPLGLSYPAMVKATGTALRPPAGDRVFAYDAATCREQSGSPVWTDGDGGAQIVGIHHGGAAFGARRYNAAVMITQEVVDTVRAQIDGPSAWRLSAI